MSSPTTEAVLYDDPFYAGYLEGELLAATNLPSRRVHARAEMAADHDELWAVGLIDGYQAYIAREYVRRLADTDRTEQGETR